jgi:hypothetical protein
MFVIVLDRKTHKQQINELCLLTDQCPWSSPRLRAFEVQDCPHSQTFWSTKTLGFCICFHVPSLDQRSRWTRDFRPSGVPDLNYICFESSEVPSLQNMRSTTVCPSSINGEDLIRYPELKESSNFNNSWPSSVALYNPSRPTDHTRGRCNMVEY